MELILQDSLPHQQVPVESVGAVVSSWRRNDPDSIHRNTAFVGNMNSETLPKEQEKNGIDPKYCHTIHNPETYNTKLKELPHYRMLDVKMETGTGKTYVYTKTIYELHKRCGFQKFIIAVPTLPIKAGTASFIGDPYVQRHFYETCRYEAKIELLILDKQKQQAKGRQNFPSSVSKYYKGNIHDSRKIYVLLLNTQLLTNGKLLTREDYDEMLGGMNVPADVIADTRPILIIDEPHRMNRDSKSYEMLLKSFRPQLVLRYGATFPEITVGKGKEKSVRKDYVNLVYDLNACQSFNQGLIKGVAKEHFPNDNSFTADKKIRITAIDNVQKAVSLQSISQSGTTHYTLKPGDYFSQIDADMDGVGIESISAKSVTLTNGQEKQVGAEFLPNIYAQSFQEGMLRLALQRHFETERKNFEREPTRIKTLALFFIDNIESYRGTADGREGWLHELFVRLLREKLHEELKSTEISDKYRAYLQATLDRADEACAGYFAQDNSDSDEAVAQEVKDILHGKKQLLSFTKEDGSLNVRRFLFSKWTLKEGWDNPNVFTICKLRTSGSEISKLQEVGRGLRLPVDEVGNRIMDDEFMLNYIVDFTERNFASELWAEINSSIARETKPMELPDVEIERVAMLRGIDADDLFDELRHKKLMDRNHIIQPENLDQLFMEYPEFNKGGVNSSRIRNRNSERNTKIGVRREIFEQLRDLWMKLNHKYVLYFDRNIEDELIKALPQIIVDDMVFDLQVVSSKQTMVKSKDHELMITEGLSTEITLTSRYLPYNDFLKRAARMTCIPIRTLHDAICIVAKKIHIVQEMFNENSLARLQAAIDAWKCEHLQGLVHYKSGNYSSMTTQLTDANGKVLDEVTQELIGVKPLEPDGTYQLSTKYLYDKLAYDSNLERENIMTDMPAIVVYGKIPRSSIAIPTVAGSTYSPDFMYVVNHKNGRKRLNVVIETKGYDNKSSIAPDEQSKINCAKEFFKEMKEEGYDIVYRPQLNNDKMKNILQSMIDES